MFLSKKSVFLPVLALSLTAGSAFAGISQASSQPQAQIEPIPFDGAPEALHILSGLLCGLITFKSHKGNVPLSHMIFTSTIGTGIGYFISKWFDKNVMN